MPLPSFLRRKSSAAPTPPESAPATPDQVRAQARRRLIGAVVLLGIGVIAFPLLFETEPRPIPVDLPIEIPSREGAPPLAMPAPAPASPAASMASAPAPAPVPMPVPLPTPAAPESAVAPVEAAPQAVAPAPASELPTPSRPPIQDEGARARALLEGKTAAAPAAAREERYVVQIGAYAADKTVREVRAQVGKTGLDTYTQVVSTTSGKLTRVRVGPFDSRAQADAAAAKLQKAGLRASVLRL